MATLSRVILLLAHVAVAVCAHAQTYPTHAIRVVVPNSPGSGDIVARLMAPPLSQRLAQPIVVENRAGAGTMLGGEIVAKSNPDGYTLLLGFSTLAINPFTYPKVPYDAQRDFAPIAQLVTIPGVIMCHPSLPAHTVRGLIALARAQPNAIIFGSTGSGTYSHATTALFMSMAGIRMLHVPYKGTGPAVAAVLSGEAALMSGNIASALPHIRSGRLRALGVTGSTRAAIAPEIPTVAESGVPGYESVQWLGLLAPAATPGPVIARLYKETTEVLHSPQMRQQLASDGAEPVDSSPTAFAAYLRAETVKWGKVLKTVELR